MNTEWLKNYQPISSVLMAYGWFLPTYLLGSDYDKIKKLFDYINANPPSDHAARQDIEDRIYSAMLDVVFHPNWRARGVWHGVKLPHFQEFSHLYESAIFAYYKREYPSCILLLLCTLEGILRSFSGLSDPKFPQLIAAIRNAPPKHILAAHQIYSATLADFLETWIYKKTTAPDADFSLSVLNRHYVLHGLSPGEFYRPQDVHRLVLAFDLLIDFLAVDANIHHTFLPDEGQDPFFDRRRNYFRSLSEGDHTIKQTWRIERDLLKDHPRYTEPRLPEPDHIQSQLMGLMDYLSLLKKADKFSPDNP